MNEKKLTLDELREIILAIMPNAIFDEIPPHGEIVIYSGLEIINENDRFEITELGLQILNGGEK
jgi:hypothetical protein